MWCQCHSRASDVSCSPLIGWHPLAQPTPASLAASPGPDWLRPVTWPHPGISLVLSIPGPASSQLPLVQDITQDPPLIIQDIDHFTIILLFILIILLNDYFKSYYNSIFTWCFVCFTISGSCLWWWTTATSSCPTSDLTNQSPESLGNDQSEDSTVSSHRALASSEAAIWNRISEDNQINPVFARNTIWNLSHNSRGNFVDGEFSMFYDD